MPESSPPPPFVRRLDARIKFLSLLAACFATQFLPDVLLPPWLAILASLFAASDMRRAGPLSMTRGGLSFALFWLVIKTVSDWADGLAWSASLNEALPLAGRLAALAVIGAAFSGLTSPIETGRAVSWILAPLAGGRAWKPALAVALTAWFMPRTLLLTSGVLAGMRARGLEKLPWRKKAFLLAGITLRILERRAGELALGLASRGLDDNRTWRFPKDGF